MTLGAMGLSVTLNIVCCYAWSQIFNGIGHDTWHYDTLYSDTQHNGLECDTQHRLLLSSESQF
jgi:hypothetical protein